MDFIFLSVGIILGFLPGLLLGRLQSRKNRSSGITDTELKERYIPRELWENTKQQEELLLLKMNKKEILVVTNFQ